MKKILTTFVTLGSVTYGAELVANWDNFSNLQDSTNAYNLVLSEGNASVSDKGVLTIAGSKQTDTNQSSAYATIDISSADLSMEKGFTLSATVSNLGMLSGTSNPVNLFGLASDSNVFLFAAAYHTYNADKTQFKFAYDGSVNNVAGGTYAETVVTKIAESNAPTTLTLTVNDNNLAWYINGELAYNSTTKDSKVSNNTTVDITGYRTQALTTLAIGGWVGSTKNGHMTGNVYNLSIYDGAMTAAEVKAMVIPEPTTATLSLLALAGLAARRRRR